MTRAGLKCDCPCEGQTTCAANVGDKRSEFRVSLYCIFLNIVQFLSEIYFVRNMTLNTGMPFHTTD